MGKVGEVVIDIVDTNSLVGYLMDYIKSNCSIPEGFKLLFNNLDDSNCIGLFPEKGNEVIECYVTGGYEAQFPFSLCIKSKPKTDVERVALYDFYNGVSDSFRELSEKLTDYGSAFEVVIDSDMYLTDIKSVSTPAVVQRSDDGSEILQALYILNYERS